MGRMRQDRGFTMIELLVVVAVISVLSAILFPVLARAREAAKGAACKANMKQIGTALLLYMGDFDELLPDRRDLKSSLPGGFRPWSSWPPSDPRAGWAAYLLEPYLKAEASWSCPSVQSSELGRQVQVSQPWTPASAPVARYWMWRFDRPDDPVPLDNLWGKSEAQAVDDLLAANNPQAGQPRSVAEVEILVDPYFPATIPSVAAGLRGRSAHVGGRNRLFLDGHVKWLRDARTGP